MSIAQRLANLADGLDADGVLSATKGGTGGTTGGGTTSPTVSQISYLGNDTAANPAGGTTITLTGTNFASGAKVLINNTQVSVVTVVSATQITFTAPALVAGSYILYVVNLDGSTAIAVPGIQYSGVPAWSTPAGNLGTSYETGAVSATLSAVSDSAVTYSVTTGTLPSGATLNSNGTISGTSPLVSGSTTYTFTVRATDAENQDTDREFSLTVNPDVVSWSSPTNGATLSATPNTVYSSSLTATSAAGSSISYTADNLPAGLSISGSTITGTPTAAGTSTTTLTATAATTSKTAQITINWTINIAADAYWKYTTLLLNSETSATPFLADASTNNFALTAYGDTKPNNFNPYTPGYYSNYWNGSSSRLIAANATSNDLSTGDWTIEAWVNQTTRDGGQYDSFFMYDQNSGFNAGMYMTIGAASFTFLVANAAKNGWSVNIDVGTGNLPPLNTWAHIAITRSGSIFTVWVNGVSKGTATYSGAINTRTGSVFQVGYSGTVDSYFHGYISNFRVVKGTAVYTSAFTPPTQPLAAITGTALLLSSSNRQIDASGNNITVTWDGDASTMPVMSFDPFVPSSSYSTRGSTYFDGSGDYVTYTGGSTTTLSADFTLEAWVYLNNLSANQPIICIGDGYNLGALFFVDTSGKLRLYANNVQILTGTGTAVANTWNHVAFVRSGTTVTAYLNGVAGGTATSSSQWSGTTTYIGKEIYNTGTGIQLAGYLSDLRLVKGTAVYTASFTPPTQPLTAVANTSLLTCQTNQPHTNSQFLDNSTSALPITRVGNATQGAFSPYGANWSNYFDGSSSYLTASSTVIPATQSTFTIEAWVYMTAGPNGTFIPGMCGDMLGGSNTNYMSFGPVTISGTRYVGFYWYDPSQRNCYGGTTPLNLNTWYHIAISISANAIKMFVNGVSQTITYSAGVSGLTNRGGTSSNFTIGGFNAASNSYIGYISNLRVVNGSAVYPADFTPSTTPLTPVANTALMTCQGPSLTDSSNAALALTSTGTVAVQRFSPFSPVIQTPVSYSTYFDGSGDYLTAPSNVAFNMSTGDFTWEAWIYPTQIANGSGIISIGSVELYIRNSAGGNTLAYYDGSTAVVTSASAVTANQWSHVALVRSSGSLKIYLNGVGGTGVSYSSSVGSNSTCYIGVYSNLSSDIFTGYISNLRIVNGTALYTANFTVPTSPLTAVTGTSLLTCQDATIRDNSSNNFTLTAVGNTAPRRQNPFGYTTSSAQDYSPQTFGASGYFDGTDDKLTIANYPGLAFGTNDFTIQAWFYTVASSLEQVIATNGWSSYAPWLIRIDSGNTLRLNMSTSGGGWDVNEASLGTVVTNQWYHVAVTRKSGTIRAFVNGIQQYTTTLASSLYNGSQALNVAGRSDASVPLKGYLTDMQLVNGTALYTSNFVPPQAPLTPVQNTTLLLNMGRAAISDKSGKVVAETVGDSKLSTAVKKYGSASMYFDGTGDYLVGPNNPNTDFGTGAFTVECWMYKLSTAGDTDWRILGGSTTGSFFFGGRDTYKLGIGRSAVAWDLQSPDNVYAPNIWNHIAYVRDNSGNINIYVNGTSVASTTNSNNYGLNGGTLQICAEKAGQFFGGYIDDLRITKGYARYTANFTPPTEALLTK